MPPICLPKVPICLHICLPKVPICLPICLPKVPICLPKVPICLPTSLYTLGMYPPYLPGYTPPRTTPGTPPSHHARCCHPGYRRHAGYEATALVHGVTERTVTDAGVTVVGVTVGEKRGGERGTLCAERSPFFGRIRRNEAQSALLLS